MNDMLAVHFGAGNIGRGFIGQLLYNSGYDVCFIDVNAVIIDEINKRKSYHVELADDTKLKMEIKNVSAINSITNKQDVIDAISKADIVTTAVGPNVLTIISSLIADGIKKRLEINKKPLNIIACENMIGGSDYLKNEICNHIEVSKLDGIISFPNSAVDRIVPAQTNDDKLLVLVEPFYEWVIDETKIIGDMPKIIGATYVENLEPFIERKLFTLNTGHAFTAYLGQYYAFNTIDEAMCDERIKNDLLNVLNETGQLLIKKHGFDEVKHKQYIDKIIKRFENKHISDEVSRVGRSPIRKISPNDRLVKPATELISYGITPKYMAKAIALAIYYKNNDDSEAIELNEYLNKNSLQELLFKYCKLDNCLELVDLIKMEYQKL
jgi:mannitol-1-phosphate 5-dehydrogenase